MPTPPPFGAAPFGPHPLKPAPHAVAPSGRPPPPTSGSAISCPQAVTSCLRRRSVAPALALTLLPLLGVRLTDLLQMYEYPLSFEFPNIHH